MQTQRPAVRRQIRHIDVWNATKVAFLFWLVVGVMWMVAGFILWQAVKALDLVENVESLAGRFGGGSFKISAQTLFQGYLLLSLVLVVAFTALTILLVMTYNLIADVVGGVTYVVEDKPSKRDIELRATILDRLRRERRGKGEGAEPGAVPGPVPQEGKPSTRRPATATTPAAAPVAPAAEETDERARRRTRRKATAEKIEEKVPDETSDTKSDRKSDKKSDKAGDKAEAKSGAKSAEKSGVTASEPGDAAAASTGAGAKTPVEPAPLVRSRSKSSGSRRSSAGERESERSARDAKPPRDAKSPEDRLRERRRTSSSGRQSGSGDEKRPTRTSERATSAKSRGDISGKPRTRRPAPNDAVEPQPLKRTVIKPASREKSSKEASSPEKSSPEKSSKETATPERDASSNDD